MFVPKNSETVILHEPSIETWEFEELNGHKGATLWFTGLPSSGKSTLANAVARELIDNKIHTVVLDGEELVYGQSKKPKTEREENLKRISEVAKLFTSAAIVNLTAFVSPYRNGREAARAMQPKSFIEVYCCPSLKACEKRDPKGLYKKARLGIIKQMTGIDVPYEPPRNPELRIDTEKCTVAECTEMIVTYLEQRGIAKIRKRFREEPEPVYTD